MEEKSRIDYTEIDRNIRRLVKVAKFLEQVKEDFIHPGEEAPLMEDPDNL